MRTCLSVLAAMIGVCVTPAFALPAVQHVQAGNVTSSSISICWDLTQAADPGLKVFADAAATQEITTTVRVEIQPLDNNRREVSTSYAARQTNRSIQSLMASKRVALARVSGLAPNTQYFLRPLALDSNGAALASGSLVPVTTAQTSAFIPESRQLVVDIASMATVSSDVTGALLVASHAAARYPLIAVVGDSFSPTVAYFDLSCLLSSSGASNLLPASGPLDLTISWLGLPSLIGTFTPSAVSFAGTANVADSTAAQLVGQGIQVHASPASPYAVVGLPLYLNVTVTDLDGVTMPSFNRALTIQCPAAATGVGQTAALSGGRLAGGHPLTFATPGSYTVAVTDPLSTTSVNVDVDVRAMTYQNWRGYHLGEAATGGNPGDDPDGDGKPNVVEYVLGGTPNKASGSVIGVTSPNSDTLRLRFNLNPLQTEYTVVVQVAANPSSWTRSAKVPSVIESHADHNVMEVSWSRNELATETGTPGKSFFARLLVEPAGNP